MSELPLNLADIGVIAVLLVSGLLAFARGLVREVLSIAAWVAAAFATIYGFPLAQPFLRQFITIALVADVLTGIAIFVVALMVGAAISHALARNVRHSAFGAVDRSLGLLFGLARGAVLVCFAYLLFAWAVPETDRPAWMTEARAIPLVEAGAGLLRTLLPDSAAEQGAAAAGEARRSVEEAIEAEKALRALGAPPPAEAPNPTGSPGSSGYKDGERKELDRLIQGAQ